MLKPVGALGVICLATALAGCGATATVGKTETKTDGYQAVFLDSGAVFFGQLQGLGTDYPVLTSVFYVQSTTDPETKKTSSVLVKRGKEWHGPDKMTINAHHIVFVEPVTSGSTVANLIAQAK